MRLNEWNVLMNIACLGAGADFGLADFELVFELIYLAG